MGTYLIPGAASVQEAANFLGTNPTPAQSWAYDPGGVLFEDTSRTDPQCAALYSGYAPSGVDDIHYVLPIPAEVQAAIGTLQAILAANPASMTDAQTATAIRAIILVLRWENARLSNGQ